jgi:UDP-glucose 4-epimerase
MKVVVTGATGNVGTQVLDRLSADDRIEEVIAVARRPATRRWPKTRMVTLDVTRDDLGPHMGGAGAVIHLAWLFQPTHRPLVTWNANVGGSIRVFDAAVGAGVPAIVYASSVGAYTPVPGAPANRNRVAEDWPTESLPTAGYGREKAYVERVLDALEARHPHLRVVRMRPGFIFQATSGTQQRRLFGGPFLPSPVLRAGRIPVVPVPAGLRFQALHASDAARAYHLAATGQARGAFNLAAEPVIDGDALSKVLEGRAVPVPPKLVRAALTGAWRAHLVPAEPALFDLAMGLPVMNTGRARAELGWHPEISATDALAEAIRGMGVGEGTGTAPLAPDSLVSRAKELATGVGRRP